jgi:hypothetical protein
MDQINADKRQQEQKGKSTTRQTPASLHRDRLLQIRAHYASQSYICAVLERDVRLFASERYMGMNRIKASSVPQV